MEGAQLENNLYETDTKNRLYSWFERSGHLNEIRAHICQRAITALRDAPAQINTNGNNAGTIKIQAINLLVADFLMNQDNLFTLKVLITEIPLLGNLREISSYVNQSDTVIQNKPFVKPRFRVNDIRQVLEALGIQSNSDITELTCHYYSGNGENQRHSLLSCLFNAVITVRNCFSNDDEAHNKKNNSNEFTSIDSDMYDHRFNNWLLTFEDILGSFNLEEKQKNILKMLIKKYYQNNDVAKTSEYKEHLKKLEEQNKEMGEKVSDLEQMLATHFHSRDSNMLFQKEQQLHSEQQKLYQLTKMFDEKEKCLNEKLRGVENEKYKLELKEKDISTREQMLKEHSSKHNNKITIINSDQVELLQEQNINLAKQLHEVKSKLNELEECKKNEHSSSTKYNIDIKKIESSLDKKTIKKLHRENEELREFIKVQQQRIEELSIKASNLAIQIEKTHQVHPAAATKTNYQINKNIKKKLNFVDNSSKKHRYAHQYISSTTTDLSTTMLESDNQTEDDMVKEARSKLKILEINTAKVEENFKDYQINRTCHNSDHKVIKVDKNPYNIRSNFSDDSDMDTLRYYNNKINLKELANKIGYYRSVRRSRNTSLSEIETSPEIFKNSRFSRYNKNITNLTPVKIVSSQANDIYKESTINKPALITKSTPNKVDYPTEVVTNICTQLPKESQSQFESTTINELLPNTNSTYLNNSESSTQNKTNHKILTDRNGEIDNIEMKNNLTCSPKNIVDSNDKKLEENSNVQKNDYNLTTTVQKDNSTNVDISSTSKKELESEPSVSFGSDRADRSSDFWT